MGEKITFIEGLPCAGKSLLTQSLQQSGEKVVHELGRVIPKEDFPGDGHSTEEITAINNWFIDKESERIAGNPSGFFDRSFFTHLVYAYAYEKLSGIESFHKTIDQYQAALDEGLLTLPDSVVYIDETPETSIKRQLFKISIGRTALASFWRDESFLRDTIVGYYSLFDNLNGIEVTTVDAEMTTEDKLNNIKETNQPLMASKSIDLAKFKSIK